MSRWHPEYDSDELQELERRETAIDSALENIEERIQELEHRAWLLRRESDGNDARARQLVAEMRADDEGITVEEAMKREVEREKRELEEAVHDRAIRRMEAGYAQ